MATVLLSLSDRFPPFTTVSVYRRSDQPGGDPLPDKAPNGSVVTSAQVNEEARLTLTGLSANTRYVAYALVEGKHHLLAFATDPAAAEGYGYVLGAVTGPLTSASVEVTAMAASDVLPEVNADNGFVTRLWVRPND